MGLGEGYIMFYFLTLVGMKNSSSHSVLEIKYLMWNSVQDI